jgi:glycerophosphoryl diester phosphodiesterase
MKDSSNIMKKSGTTLFDLIERLFHFAADGFFAGLPQPKPGEAALRRCRIVSHRGEHDNIAVFENTLAAFDRARDNGVWGIECDIRWTKDLVPVVFHDADLQRLFEDSLTIGQTMFDRLRKEFPQIPTLSEILTRYGKNMHLMVEIKAEVYPDPAYQRRILSQAFSGLVPEEDYHFLALNPQLFEYADFVSPSAYIPVAQLNLREMSRIALQEKYGGIAGHYLFITDARMQAHHAHGQKVGTAYICSRNSLFREINRGVDWIFSNHACRIQDILNHGTLSER